MAKKKRNKKEKSKLIEYLTNLSLKEKVLATFSIMAFLLVLVYLSAISPINSSITNTNNLIENLSIQKSQLEVQNSESNKLTKEIYLSNEKYNNLINGIPKREEQANLLNSIASIENEAKVTMKNTNFVDKSLNNNSSVAIYEANIEVEGSYKNIVDFINLLQNNKRKLVVESAKIGLKDSSNIDKENSEFSGNIIINYFYLKNSENNKNE